MEGVAEEGGVRFAGDGGGRVARLGAAGMDKGLSRGGAAEEGEAGYFKGLGLSGGARAIACSAGPARDDRVEQDVEELPGDLAGRPLPNDVGHMHLDSSAFDEEA